MTEIIDLTVSPQPEIIEIGSSEQEDAPLGCHQRTQENKKRKKKKGKALNSLSNDGGVDSPAQRLSAPSSDIGHKSGELNEPEPLPGSLSNPRPTSPSTSGEAGLFCIDAVAVPVGDGSLPPDPVESNGNDDALLLPSHVTIFNDNGATPAEVIPPPKPSSDDEEYIEYLDYEDRKAPGLVRYFEAEGQEANHSKLSIFKCKNCGAEGDHKTYDCPVQICLTCGARDEHSTRSCPISKTCYTCGMKGHINKTCPNRYTAHTTSTDPHGDCDRCGSRRHNMNECPTLWRIYQYVNDEERILIMQSREERKQLAISEGGEGYIGREVWCYNCANTGHLGDDCDELPHPGTLPTEYSAFSSHNIMSGPFYDPATEPVYIKRGHWESNVDRPRLPDDWDPGAPADVGRRGKNKDKERLEKRFRQQEDEGEDWFNDRRNVKKRGMGQQAPPSAPRGRSLKFGSFKDGGYEHSTPPASASLTTSSSGSSLLARLGDSPAGRNRPYQSDNSIRIRGAATERRNHDGRSANSHKGDWERGHESQERRSRDKSGSRRGNSHGPRFRGGYER